MMRRRRRFRLDVEALEGRLALSSADGMDDPPTIDDVWNDPWAGGTDPALAPPPADDPFGPAPPPSEPDPVPFDGDQPPAIPLPPAPIGPAGPAY